MATKGMTVYNHQGEDYEINDANIANEFSTSAAYAKGDYVYYQGKAYRFTSDHSAGAWNSGHVTQVLITGEIKQLKEDMAEIEQIKEDTEENTADIERLTNETGKIIGSRYTIPSIFDGSSPNGANQYAICTGGYGRRDSVIAVSEGDVISAAMLKPLASAGYRYCYGFYTYSDNEIAPTIVRAWAYDEKTSAEKIFPVTIKGNEKYMALTIAAYDSEDNPVQLRIANYTPDDILITNIRESEAETIEEIKKITDPIGKDLLIIPALRNGSCGNPGNQNAISMKTILPTNGAKTVLVQFNHKYDLVHGLHPVARLYSVYTEGQVPDNPANLLRNLDPIPDNYLRYVSETSYLFDVSTAEAFAVGAFDTDGTSTSPLRIAYTGDCISIFYIYDQVNQIDETILKKLMQARWQNGGTADPVTFLHTSDPHADAGAMKRIEAIYSKISTYVDERICTGDMVANTGGAISSWWPEGVLTCIGNHDSATWESDTYNWTGVSMAQRSAYYIEPFESGWGITHGAGTSYYYKDYAGAKLRLIVLDAMLYTGSATETEAAAQTSWMAGILASAITAGYHVLIAIHAPHGGSEPVECSFTKAGETTMPTYGDCNTPDDVIDTVAEAIGNGLQFAGYICGHTHQDAIWKATEDGKQLMYCITCANVSQQAQWKNSDQYRDAKNDAANLVTVDTNHSLVKIIRIGGADGTIHMGIRKMICFDYANGTMVNEE